MFLTNYGGLEKGQLCECSQHNPERKRKITLLQGWPKLIEVDSQHSTR